MVAAGAGESACDVRLRMSEDDTNHYLDLAAFDGGKMLLKIASVYLYIKMSGLQNNVVRWMKPFTMPEMT